MLLEESRAGTENLRVYWPPLFQSDRLHLSYICPIVSFLSCDLGLIISLGYVRQA